MLDRACPRSDDSRRVIRQLADATPSFLACEGPDVDRLGPDRPEAAPVVADRSEPMRHLFPSDRTAHGPPCFG
jgi:hypothetical protein